MKPCLERGCPNLTRSSRCAYHESLRQKARNLRRPHYRGSYDRRAAKVRAEAELCWLCGGGPRPNDPWQADHVTPGDPDSELRPAHRSCNARRGAG